MDIKNFSVLFRELLKVIYGREDNSKVCLYHKPYYPNDKNNNLQQRHEWGDSIIRKVVFKR